MSDSAPSSLVYPVVPNPVDATLNDDVTNDGEAPSSTLNGKNEAPMEAADANFGNGVTGRPSLNESAEALGAMIYGEGNDKVVNMLEVWV